MAALHLVTGYKGTAHITSADQGVLNAMLAGAGDYVLSKGRMFEAEIVSNNLVRIHNGCLMMNGRQVNLDGDSYIDANIANGTSAMKRHDIIAIHYEINSTTGVESVQLVVVKGTAASSAPTDPTISSTNSILDGATVHRMPLYRVVLNGLVIERVEPIFQALAPMADFHHGFYKQNMLINGDFQCNQRGEDAYDTSNKSMYTVDMWRGYKVKVTVRKDGIKLAGTSTTEQGYFTQFIQLGKLETKTYTISAMVDGKICTYTITPGGTAKEKDFGKFKISALTVSTWDNNLPEYNYYNNKLKINILPVGTNEITINYIDVFEGSVAHPHVKEDPATALMRCRRYVQGGVFFSPALFRNDDAASSGNYKYRIGISLETMHGTPLLESCDWLYYDNNGTSVTGHITDSAVTDASKNHIWAWVTGKLMGDKSNGVRLVYVVSCEPNDA